MKQINSKVLGTLLILGLIIWAVCGATMFIGMAVTSLTNALIIHALAAPIIAATYLTGRIMDHTAGRTTTAAP